VTVIEASAPGKLVLVGEYAVLDGGAALSAAVDTRAKVHLGPAPSDLCELQIDNSGDSFAFSLSKTGIPEWRDEPGHLGLLLEIALEQTVDKSSPPAPFKVSLCTRDFYTSDKPGAEIKKGTGSSAALAVALTSVLQSYLGQTPDFGVCDAVHRRFQGGKGSGIDVLTSWYGGVVSKQSGNGAAIVDQLDWLTGLHVSPVWTGQSASTPAMLDRLAGYRKQSPDDCARLMGRLGKISAQALACWKAGDAPGFMRQIETYAWLLKELDAAAHIGVWSAAHLQLEAAAQSAGTVYKPSGAGGGDYGLLYSADKERLQHLQQELKAEGFESTGLEWTRRGMEVGTPAAVS
jgi:phosphomevalonate kinase